MHHTSRPSAGRAIAAVATLAVLGVLAYFGVQYFSGNMGRSTAAYCQMWKDEGAKLQKESNTSIQQAQQSGDPFASFNLVMSSPHELADFFSRLDKVAPNDIEPDVAQYADAWQKTADNLGSDATDPLSFGLAQLSVAAQASGAEQNVAKWTQTNCTALYK